MARLLHGLDGSEDAVGLHFEDDARFQGMRDFVAREDDRGEEEELTEGGSANGQRAGGEAESRAYSRAKHVGKRVVLLVDGDGSGIGNFGVLVDGEPGRRKGGGSPRVSVNPSAPSCTSR